MNYLKLRNELNEIIPIKFEQELIDRKYWPNPNPRWLLSSDKFKEIRIIDKNGDEPNYVLDGGPTWFYTTLFEMQKSNKMELLPELLIYSFLRHFTISKRYRYVNPDDALIDDESRISILESCEKALKSASIRLNQPSVRYFLDCSQEALDIFWDIHDNQSKKAKATSSEKAFAEFIVSVVGSCIDEKKRYEYWSFEC